MLGAADPRLQGLARRVWSGSHARLLCWGDPDSVHGYIGGDVAQWAARGAPALAREYLDSLLAASTSTLGQAELSSRKSRDFGDNLPPHATAAAQVVDLVRNLIVGEVRTWVVANLLVARHAPQSRADSMGSDRREPG